MARKLILSTVATALICLGLAPIASAGAPIRLVLSQSAAFSVLGASCGGIQEKVYATGFAANGYPTGVAQLETRCGGSGRGGGYKTHVYTGSATVVWDWFGETRAFAAGTAEYNPAFEATDAHGDRIYNSAGQAYLETGEPPFAAPAPPTGLSATSQWVEVGETEHQQFFVTWTSDPQLAGLITSSTVTATPVGGGATLTAQTSGGWNQAALGPLTANTKYRITVTSSDLEGTSQPATVEVNSGGEEGEGGGGEEGEKEKGGGGAGKEVCESSQGTIKLSPGLTSAPHAQKVTVKGAFSGCTGPLGATSATFTAHLSSGEGLSCSTLSGPAAAPSPVSLSVKWSGGAGTSTGALVLPITEVAFEGFGGALEGGPLLAAGAFSAEAISESYTGGATCGVPAENGKAKAVKSGSFVTSAVTIG